ncbi:hypothetical protein D9M72_558540 [compost metagenome]
MSYLELKIAFLFSVIALSAASCCLARCLVARASWTSSMISGLASRYSLMKAPNSSFCFWSSASALCGKLTPAMNAASAPAAIIFVLKFISTSCLCLPCLSSMSRYGVNARL